MRIANFMFAVIAFVIAFSPAPASGARTAPGSRPIPISVVS